MRTLNSQGLNRKKRDIKVLQFGEGNFLRAFADYMIDIMNERGVFDGDIVLVKPIQFGSLEQFAVQEYNYTVLLRGLKDGREYVERRIVTSVADAVDSYGEYERYAAYAKLPSLRYIISNTTEAGIVYDPSDRLESCPPSSYPGKLTKFLYERYVAFDGAEDKGLVMLPVELIDDNGIELKRCVLAQIDNWGLPGGFRTWVNEACIFTSTLVDRIVTGYPRTEDKALWEEFGYEDRLLVTAEPFGLWVIESDRDISGEFPLVKAGLPVIFTSDQKPYKQRKVRILNGAHTSFVLASYMAGNDTVGESMNDRLFADFMHSVVYDEVIPTLSLPKDDCLEFAGAVNGRFRNPFIRHELLSIALNSVSKWRARCLPSVIGYYDSFGCIPKHLAFSLAALLNFYCGDELRDGALIGHRTAGDCAGSAAAAGAAGDGTACPGNEYMIRDDAAVLELFAAHAHDDASALTAAYFEFESEAFAKLKPEGRGELEKAVAGYLDDIRACGVRAAMGKLDK